MSALKPPLASFLGGHCTPENNNNADAILPNDLLDDDSGSYSDGEVTDDNGNFEFLIKQANNDNYDNNNNNSDDDDDVDDNGYISDDEEEIENLLEDQKMPAELVLSVAHGYGSGSHSSIADPFYSKKQVEFM
jgi:hypothetical protein